MDIWRRKVLLSFLKIFDLLVLCGAFIVSASIESSTFNSLSFGQFMELRLKVGNFLLFILLLATWHIIFSAFGLYHSRRLSSVAADAKDLLKSSFAATCVLSAAAYCFDITMVTPLFVAAFFPILSVNLISSRALLRFCLHQVRLRGRNLRHILIAGTNARAIKIAKMIREKPELGYQLVGFVDQDWPGMAEVGKNGFKTVSDFQGFREYLRTHVVDEVIITLPFKSMYSRGAWIALICEEQGIIVRHPADVFSNKASKSTRDYIEDIPVITRFTGPPPGWQLAVKRMLDIFLSLSMLLVLWPFMTLAALLIKLDSRGPAIFVQERVGLNKRRFRLYKFRTMVEKAETLQENLEALNEATGPVFKIKNDPRITRLGRILRKTSIDELPQFFNVLKGDMSLVGPRPLPVRDYNGFSEDWQRRRFSVRPGLTCLWQVNGRSQVPFEKWMELDMHYIDHWSLWLDFKILLRTVPAVFLSAGSM